MGARAAKLILFVCTGNICRSPMAEALLRARLTAAGRSDWRVGSAGLAALPGLPASREAVEAVRERGGDLSAHRSRWLNRALVDEAALIVVMTTEHRDHMRVTFPEAGEKVCLIRSFDPAAREADLDDPIGGPVSVYRVARGAIEAALPGLLKFMAVLT